MEKFKVLGCLPRRENRVVAGFRKKRITRCTVDYSRNVVGSARGCRWEGLSPEPCSVAHSLELWGQCTSPLLTSVSPAVKWKLEVGDLKGPSTSENGKLYIHRARDRAGEAALLPGGGNPRAFDTNSPLKTWFHPSSSSLGALSCGCP